MYSGDIIQACHVLHIYYALIVIVHIKSAEIFSNFIVLIQEIHWKIALDVKVNKMTQCKPCTVLSALQ